MDIIESDAESNTTNESEIEKRILQEMEENTTNQAIRKSNIK